MTPDENKKKKQEIVCSRWGQCEFLSHAGFIADGRQELADVTLVLKDACRKRSR